MTQDVQPLTWSKRTNIEEHQQFFSKINEIIGNLAPTVDEAEQAIAQATAAIASANDAVATANAASAAASAAASQAQTAATTVAGYDARMTAAEGDIDALQAADQTMTGNISALGTRMTAAESKNSQQDTAIAELQTADANNVKITGAHKIGDHAGLLTGNQTKSGNLTFLDQIVTSRAQNQPHIIAINTGIPSVTSKDAAAWSYPIIFRAKDLSELGHLTFGRTAAGKSYLTLSLIDSDNVTKTVTLGVND